MLNWHYTCRLGLKTMVNRADRFHIKGEVEVGGRLAVLANVLLMNVGRPWDRL